MQKIDIDGIIRKTFIELKNDGNLEEKYKNITNKPRTDINKLSFKAVSKIIFYNNYCVKNNFNVKFMKLNKIYIKYKKDKKEQKGYLGKFYDGTNEFIKTIKITFIKNFINEVKFCPYCGKNSLTYFGNIDKFYNKKDDNKRTFELDHFFPKDTYYNIGFNLYNLIPSCKPCNHLKSNSNPFDKKEFFHPYFGWIKNNKIIKDSFNDKVTFNKKDKKTRKYILNTEHSELFNLKKIYDYSQDTKNDIWFIRDKIEKIKTDKINSKKLGLLNNFNLEERKDLFFKNYYPTQEQDILKFSNGKLKKDLIENLNILNNNKIFLKFQPLTPPLIQKSFNHFPKKYLEKLKNKQEESIIARYLISKLVEQNFGIKNFLPETSKNGIPVFKNNIFWSISHKKGIVFIGVARQIFGLDLEIIKPRDKNVLDIFGDEEYQVLGGKNLENFYKIWTVKEALIKYNLVKLDDMKNMVLTGIQEEKNIFGGVEFSKKLKIGNKEIFLQVNNDIVLSLCK